MIDRLLEKILEIIDYLIPFTIIEHYNRGVRLRFGINKGVLNPGLHFKIPFIDIINTHMVKVTTMNIPEQSVTTKDWIQVVCRAVIKYEVSDVEKLLLEVNDPIDAILDMAKGIIFNSISSRNWEECNNDELLKEVNRRVKKESEKWGIRVIDVTFTDLGKIPSYRIFNSMTNFQQT